MFLKVLEVYVKGSLRDANENQSHYRPPRVGTILACKNLARFLQRLARYKNYFLMLFYSNQAIDTRRKSCIIHYMDRGISPASK